MRLPALVSILLAGSSCVFVIHGDDDVATSRTRHPARVATTTGERQLTLDDLYDPAKKLDFNGKPPTSLEWIDGQSWLAKKTEEGTPRYDRVDADTGNTTPFVDVAKLQATIARVPGQSAESAAKLARIDLESMDAARKSLLVTIDHDLWVVPVDGGDATRVTTTPDTDEQEASFSPDGRRVAFVRKNDLFVASTSGGGETRVTQDGGDLVLNGILDWIYQEEIYGRGHYRAYWWSPDSARIAFLRLDEAGVPTYTLVDDVAEPIRVETSPYPRPGDPNPKATLAVFEVASGETRWPGLLAKPEDEPLIVDVSWSPANDLYYQVQDRAQTRLDLVRLASGESAPRVLFTDRTQAWVERMESPEFLADGSYLWFSERSGWKHLYRYKDGNLLGAVTSGEWEARTLHGVDEANGWVYFSGTKDQPIGSDVYRVKLDGSSIERLSKTAGTHAATFNPTFTRYTDAWSDVSTPTQVRLHRADGGEVRTIDANAVPVLAQFTLAKPELFQVKTRDGFAMEAMMLKPPGFDPSRRYPVMTFLYAGPHAPTVANRWGGTGGMFQQLLAQRGVIVWSCDNRSASGKGAVSAWPAYGRLGESECADIHDAIEWLKRQSWVDPDRIGVTGWSYGGFMTSYLLTHTKDFALGLAGGSVTDWRDYDSIYTERYMKLLKDNADGYARTSVRKAAADLHGRLVLVHGAIDDNVHPSNTTRLADALQRANKRFGIQLYGKQRHGVVTPQLSRHWRETMLAEIEEHLLGVQP